MSIGMSKPVVAIKRAVLNLFYSPLGRLLPDKLYLQCMYFFKIRRKLNLKDPKTFNEKMQWLKLYDRDPLYTRMVDKASAKDYVAERIGSEYIIPTLGLWDSFDQIDFDALPDQFVLKCTHDSGGLVICKDKRKLDRNAARKKLEKCLETQYFWYGREWPYKKVKPQILAEAYMEDPATEELRDYKFLCFDGEPKLMYIASDRFSEKEESTFDFFDMDFQHLPFTQGHPNATKPLSCPQSFEQMKELARKLSAGFPHLRVDFYEIEGRIYFGELTFYHLAGLVPFHPEEWDRKLGDLVRLPEKP